MPPNNVSGSDGLCAASLGDSHSTPLCSTALSSHASASALLVDPAPKHTTLARPVVSRAATKESMRSDPESDEHCVVLLNESFLGNKAELHSLRHSLSLNVSWSVASQAESATIFNLIGLMPLAADSVCNVAEPDPCKVTSSRCARRPPAHTQYI